MDGDLDSVLRALRELSSALAPLGLESPPERILELGPGRTPDFATAFALAGAAEVVALDTRLQIGDDARSGSRYVELANRLDAGAVPEFTVALGDTNGGAGERLTAWSAAHWPVRFIQYDGRRLPNRDDSVDLIVSKSVLEHVPAEGVPALLSEMYRVLRPGGVVAHSVDLRDHMRISGDLHTFGDWLDALRYSDRVFDAMFSRRSTFINRWRTPEWREALLEAGFQIRAWEAVRLALDPSFERSALRDPWATYDLNTLSEARLIFAAGKPAWASD